MALAALWAVGAMADNQARYDLAKKYYDDKNYASAYPIFVELAEQKFDDAAGYAGMFNELGYGTEKNPAMAKYFYEISLDQRQPWWCYRYGKMAFDEEDYDKAWQCFKVVDEKATKVYYRGSATFRLAAMAIDNLGGSATDEQIAGWLRDAAKQSYDQNAQKKANNLMKELNIPLYTRDEFFQKIKTVGETGKSLFDLGKSYYDGFGSETADLAKAFVYFNASANKHYLPAFPYIAKIYKNKSLPIYDEEQSAQIYTEYRELLDDKLQTPEAKASDFYAMAEIYRDGLGVEKNNDIAVFYYRLGADMGDSGCQLWLGILLDKMGQYNEALYWLEESGRNGQGWSAYLAGQMYEEGRNGSGENYIPKNLDLAIEMYRCSAATSNYYASRAKEALSRLGASVDGQRSKINTRTKPTPKQ